MTFFEIFLSVGAYHKKKIAQRGGVRPTAANLLPCFASVMFCIVRRPSSIRRQGRATVAANGHSRSDSPNRPHVLRDEHSSVARRALK